MKQKLLTLVVLSLLVATGLFSQETGVVRGNVYDKSSGEPVMFATVKLGNTGNGAVTDEQGFYSITDVAPGEYTLSCSFIGYDSTSAEIKVKPGEVVYQSLYMTEGGINLGVVDVSSTKLEAQTEVKMSTIKVTPRRIKSLPSVGGQPDIAQYLPVLPGVIFTGDQGGQLYIRGGSPVQNRVLLDGMTIYNPFHSIGFFSVFETETVRSMDVYTGAFSAEYGGRASAILDIKTREGNRRRLAGAASINPFQGKLLLEGPIVPLKEEGGGSLSFMLTGKTSLIQETSKSLYAYASDTALYNLGINRLPEEERPPAGTPEEVGLPFSFTDLFGKLSLVAGNGTKLNLFGFSFDDQVNYPSLNLDWNSFGAGANFSILPPRTNLIADGTIAYSNYDVTFNQIGQAPRRSKIGGFSVMLNFTNFHKDGEVKYGVEFNGIQTELEFENFRGVGLSHNVNTTEIGGYVKYRHKFNRLVIEPSFRLHAYASLGDLSPEPRLGLKYNVSDKLRLKMAGGIHTQNLIGTTNDLDIVNLFVGFVTDPDQSIIDPETGDRTNTKLQRATHVLAGIEYDVNDKLTLNLEPYFKDFSQIININRNRTEIGESVYAAETGEAYGIDFSAKYDSRRWYLWLAYSLTRVTRNDGEQEYPPIFDRRHNLNLLATYTFGSNLEWEASARWNYGSGFPFTEIQGFSSIFFFNQGLDTDPLTDNPDLYTIPSEDRNGGRLPDYSRIDLSLKYTREFNKYLSLEIVGSVTNLSNRDNIFFFVAEENQRINQLPILPSLGVNLNW